MLLPAPEGQPQHIQLPDGSLLVPLAKVDAAGNQTTLDIDANLSAAFKATATATKPAAAAAAAPAPAATAASAPAGGGGTLRAAEGTVPTADGRVDSAGREFEPLGFLYNEHYYKRYFDGGDLDVNNREKVEERSIESTFTYLRDKEPEVDDFGVTGVKVRKVDEQADQDLLKVNPRAHLVIDVHGVQGDGVERSIPTVINEDGATYTDPKLRGGG